jgi:glyoxylase-like metal-dependent hydrolase (beta-lactamase superfamily II)
VSIEAVTEHVHRIEMGDANLFLIESAHGLALIDAGFPGCMEVVTPALASIGRAPSEIADVLVTHCHPDHAGGLAELRRATGAKAWMHPADAAMVRSGQAFRAYQVSPGLMNHVFERKVIRRSPHTFEPADVGGEIVSGQTIPAAGGILALGTPGHSQGHLVFIWPHDGGILFTGDAAVHRRGIRFAPINEDLREATESLRLIGRQEFQIACFAHGEPIVGSAADEFARRWPS